MDSATLHWHLKSWRQQQVANQTTEHSLGYRISSIYIPNDTQPIEITSTEAKNLTVEDTLDLIQGFVSLVYIIYKPTVRIFAQNVYMARATNELLQHLQTWVKMQNGVSIVASSLLLTFDYDDFIKCKCQWVDFTHVDVVVLNVCLKG